MIIGYVYYEKVAIFSNVDMRAKNYSAFFGFFAFSLVHSPVELIVESGLTIISLLAAALPEAFWTFIRTCICDGLLPALVDIPV